MYISGDHPNPCPNGSPFPANFQKMPRRKPDFAASRLSLARRVAYCLANIGKRTTPRMQRSSGHFHPFGQTRPLSRWHADPDSGAPVGRRSGLRLRRARNLFQMPDHARLWRICQTWRDGRATDALSEWNAVEERYKSKRGLIDGRRLGCQATVQGDVVIDVPPESQVHKQVVRKRAEARADHDRTRRPSCITSKWQNPTCTTRPAIWNVVDGAARSVAAGKRTAPILRVLTGHATDFAQGRVEGHCRRASGRRGNAPRIMHIWPGLL